jgi:IS5 family transposase
MIPRDNRQAPQRDLPLTYLEDILNTRHKLVQMEKRTDWAACEQLWPVIRRRSGTFWAIHPIARRLAAGTGNYWQGLITGNLRWSPLNRISKWSVADRPHAGDLDRR